jgi:hypothetical protein
MEEYDSFDELHQAYKTNPHPFIRYDYLSEAYEFGYLVIDKDNHILGFTKSVFDKITKVHINPDCDVYMQALRLGFIIFRTPDTRTKYHWRVSSETNLASLEEQYLQL